jgi:hypothetical protein
MIREVSFERIGRVEKSEELTKDAPKRLGKELFFSYICNSFWISRKSWGKCIKLFSLLNGKRRFSDSTSCTP